MEKTSGPLIIRPKTMPSEERTHARGTPKAKRAKNVPNINIERTVISMVVSTDFLIL
jgi:hypothetical protein